MKIKYLGSHILLVSKEDLERIKEIHKSAFKTKERDLSKICKGTFRRTKEDLFMLLWKPLQTKVQIDDLRRESCIN